MTTTKVYTTDEVARHNTAADGWLIIDGNVLNVSTFLDDHPGGREVLLALLGTDASQAFADVQHSARARQLFPSLQVGRVAGPRNMRLADVKVEQDAAAAKDRNACWVVIANKVYDLTAFLDLHPGGRDILLCHSGTDASEPFAEVNHSDTARRMMATYYVADLHPEDRVATGNPRPESNRRSVESKKKTRDNSLTSVDHFIISQLKVGAIILVVIAAAVCWMMRV